MNAMQGGVRSSSDPHGGVDPEPVELRLRRLVAETLGTSAGELSASVSLADELAVDSLDLLELALQIEEALDVSLPERLLATVRTYGDLAALVLDRVHYPATVALEPALVRARITWPSSLPEQAIVRVFVLTPYAVQFLTDDARRTGQGTRVELTVPGSSRGPVLAHLHAMFADLAASGIVVDVNRDEGWEA